MDRKEFYFNIEIADSEMEEYMKSNYYIYTYHPVDHPEIHGSCEEFATRNRLDFAAVKNMSLEEVEER